MPAKGGGMLLVGGGEGGGKAGGGMAEMHGVLGESAIVKGRGVEGRRRGWLESVQGDTVSLQVSV